MNSPKKYYRIGLYPKKNYIEEITPEEFERLLKSYIHKACYPLCGFDPRLPNDVAYICGYSRNCVLLVMNKGRL